MGVVMLWIAGAPRSLYVGIVEKLRRSARRHPVFVDVIKRGDTIYVLGLDDGLTLAFIYKLYLMAREGGFQTALARLKYIDDSWIPEEVKRAAEKWLRQGLSSEEAQALRRLDMLNWWVKVSLERECPQ